MRRHRKRARRTSLPRFRTARVERLEARRVLAAAVIDIGATSTWDGWIFEGIDSNDLAGKGASLVGDMNGDGFDDLVIGAHTADFVGGYDYNGEVYLIHGNNSPHVDLDNLDGANGTLITATGVEGQLGVSVAGGGDFNGDGLADVAIMGGPFSFKKYIVFGKAGGLGASLDVSELDGTNGFEVLGGGDVRLQSIGHDINGDGFDELIFADGGGGVGSVGRTYVIFGTDEPPPAQFDPETLDGSNGFIVDGIDSSDLSRGRGVKDVNGDGFDDLLIVARGGDPNGVSNAGETHVVFGHDQGFPAQFDLATLNGTNGFVINGVSMNDRTIAATAVDLNGDGFHDIVLRSFEADGGGVPDSGIGYVVYGKSSGHAASLNLSTLDGTNGFEFYGVEALDHVPRVVSEPGDVNGDGIDDLLFASTFAGAEGRAYVLFGDTQGFPTPFPLTSLDGTNGFRVDGAEVGHDMAESVSASGDLNGDGYDELVLGVPNVDVSSISSEDGVTYVIKGSDFSSEVTQAGDTTADLLTGSAAVDVIVAGSNDDTLIGGGGADVLRAGQGDDRIVIGDAGFFRVRGGGGTDTVELGAFDFDLGTVPDSKFEEIERIDLSQAAGGQTLTVSKLEVLNLSDSSNTLVVDGTSADTVDLGSGQWLWTTAETIGPSDFHVYVQGQAVVKAQVGMQVIGDVSLVGDVNGDEVVNGLDANIISANFLLFEGGGATLADGDANGDGFVDGRDANELSENWLAELTNGLAESASESVAVGDDLNEAATDAALLDLIGLNFLRFRSGGATRADGDVNGDGYVDGLDVNWLWGRLY